jgi:predicted Zn-dependent protease
MILRRILAGSIVAVCLVAQAEPVNPKIVARYKEMLAARPTEGTALDRLWKIYLDENRTNELIDEYKAGRTFASEMVLGHLLRKVARLEEAAAAFDRAAALDAKSPLPWQALAQLRTEQGQHRAAAEAFERSDRCAARERCATSRTAPATRQRVAGRRRRCAGRDGLGTHRGA